MLLLSSCFFCLTLRSLFISNTRFRSFARSHFRVRSLRIDFDEWERVSEWVCVHNIIIIVIMIAVPLYLSGWYFVSSFRSFSFALSYVGWNLFHVVCCHHRFYYSPFAIITIMRNWNSMYKRGAYCYDIAMKLMLKLSLMFCLVGFPVVWWWCLRVYASRSSSGSLSLSLSLGLWHLLSFTL